MVSTNMDPVDVIERLLGTRKFDASLHNGVIQQKITESDILDWFYGTIAHHNRSSLVKTKDCSHPTRFPWHRRFNTSNRHHYNY